MIERSLAYERAIEILAAMEFSHIEEHAKLPHAGGGLSPAERAERYQCQRKAKDDAIEKAKPVLHRIAKQMTANKEQVSADIIGARCLQEVLPGWVAQGGSGGYTKLHVGELNELLRLRGEDCDGMKP